MAKTDAFDDHILDHPQSQELDVISVIIDVSATIYYRILQDLNGQNSETSNLRKGMSAEQVLR